MWDQVAGRGQGVEGTRKMRKQDMSGHTAGGGRDQGLRKGHMKKDVALYSGENVADDNDVVLR